MRRLSPFQGAFEMMTRSTLHFDPTTTASAAGSRRALLPSFLPSFLPSLRLVAPPAFSLPAGFPITRLTPSRRRRSHTRLTPSGRRRSHTRLTPSGRRRSHTRLTPSQRRRSHTRLTPSGRRRSHFDGCRCQTAIGCGFGLNDSKFRSLSGGARGPPCEADNPVVLFRPPTRICIKEN